MPTEDVFLLDDVVLAAGLQASPQVALALRQRLLTLLSPFGGCFDATLDRRLVWTLALSIDAMTRWRHWS